MQVRSDNVAITCAFSGVSAVVASAFLYDAEWCGFGAEERLTAVIFVANNITKLC